MNAPTAPSPQPVLFIGHGSPMLAIEPDASTDAWRALGASLLAAPRPPRTVLAVSAHWLTRGTAVTAMPRPRTIHDFGGFPRALHEIEYPAPGDPALAARVRGLLAPAGVDVHLDAGEWGLDHGTWAVLRWLFPDADLPVVQLSLDATVAPARHLAIARALGPLRDEGVLVVASGNIVHNLMRLQRAPDVPAPAWATRFSDRVVAALVRGTASDLQALATWALPPVDDPDARLSVPTAEHFLPLLYAAALRRPDEPVSFPLRGIAMGAIDMTAVRVGN